MTKLWAWRGTFILPRKEPLLSFWGRSINSISLLQCMRTCVVQCYTLSGVQAAWKRARSFSITQQYTQWQWQSVRGRHTKWIPLTVQWLRRVKMWADGQLLKHLVLTTARWDSSEGRLCLITLCSLDRAWVWHPCMINMRVDASAELVCMTCRYRLFVCVCVLMLIYICSIKISVWKATHDCVCSLPCC